MTAKFYAILTNQGAARLANAAALGTKLNLTQMAVGDANGTLPAPDPAQTKLINQKRIAPLNRLSIDPDNASQIIAEQVIPENEGGFWIRELGLFDDSGVLIAVANCPETYKPLLQEGSGRTQTIRMVLIVSSTAAVTLKIDPAVVLATRQYVDEKVIEVKAYADDLMKKHIAADNPHAQYLQAKNNLSDVADKAKGRSALGLGSAALKNIGTSGDAVPLANGANTWSAKQTFSGGAAGSLSGNATTASKLQAARKIGGVAFDGSADITLPGVNAAGNQATSGNAATATKLQTTRKIGGVAFDGSADINLPGVNAAGNQATSGNAATATKLQTVRKIGGVAFDGSADINLPGVNAAGNQATSGNAATATKLKSASSLWGNNFDGSGNVDGTLTVKGSDADNAFFKLIQGNTTTDGGYIAVGNNGKDKGYVELGTVDDAITNIYARKRDASNKVVASLELLNESNDTKFPGKVTFPKTSSFGVNADNKLGDSSIVIGDSDTGFKQNGDGVLDVFANNQQVCRFDQGNITTFKSLQHSFSTTPAGSGAFAEQLTNASAPFVQKNWNWTPGNGGLYVPLVKGLSNRALQGYTTAVSFGYLLSDNQGFAIPCIHVKGDGDNDALWQFDPNSKVLYAPGDINANGATLQHDGNISGSIWGGYINDWLKSQFGSRDNNINSRATVDYVNNDNTPTINACNRGAIDSRIAWWQANQGAGAIGTHGLMSNRSSRAINPNDIVSGSDLQWASAGEGIAGIPTGNWRALGWAQWGNSGYDGERVTLYVRVS